MDSDDAYLFDYLQSCLQYIQEHPEVDMLFVGLVVDGNLYTVMDARDNSRTIHIIDKCQGATSVVRAEIFHAFGGFPKLRFWEDYFFFEKATSQNLCVHKIHDKRYVYYRDENDAVAASDLSQAKCKKKRLINTSFLDTSWAIADPDSVHQLVDFSMRSKRHRAILRAAHQFLDDCKRCILVVWI
ncbi:hypothetical protein RU820_07940 [Acidithiobacillus ferrooxidans]|uniref:hypothetical protein n=1 Tax=Acidithiobacillus TaxID=119977 RepID=UPI0011D071A4|nr:MULTISPECIES: hypothetical protein [Acidithiobacillus]MBN6744133.1 hypothetical protein [Acidithiobacillus sp. MC2.2]MBN6747312.1 hypothetical protein [Acidithiobacillus sp. PG05]MCR0970343.1 hypothetical protein [Acidithiobacillus ferrooxidans]MCR1349180.1 hypothetical protein [Acidithiobacillus ferrooxidans]MCR1350623.1 hypothetical protein [Acidithiobacillus ferrooxidans]